MEQEQREMIGIIDYGLGNLFSLEKALSRCNIPYLVHSNPEKLISCDRLILSGVGHFGYGMTELETRQLIPFLKESVLIQKKPILGICLGMQLFGSYSEESNSNGLGFINNKVKKLTVDRPFKIPHIGWNTLEMLKPTKLFEQNKTDQSFYFTHSFAFQTSCEASISTTEYGSTKFVSVIEQENIFGVQFHPEKSFNQGLLLLQNFAKL